jgi:hypothetical protein
VFLLPPLLQGNDADDEGAAAVAEALSHCPALARVDLSGMALTPWGSRVLAGAFRRGAAPALQALALGGNAIADEGEGPLLEGCVSWLWGLAEMTVGWGG